MTTGIEISEITSPGNYRCVRHDWKLACEVFAVGEIVEFYEYKGRICYWDESVGETGYWDSDEHLGHVPVILLDSYYFVKDSE